MTTDQGPHGLKEVTPADSAYTLARSIWNGYVDKMPARIVYCESVADVKQIVRWCRARSLTVSVRGGGHSVRGASLNDGGVVIDVSKLNQVTVDPKDGTALVGGGALIADVERETAKINMFCPTGVVPYTGFTGLAMGGGYGWFARRYGLSADHIASASIVTWSGATLHIDDESHPQLMWALRGAGATLGVVTELTVKLRPVETVRKRVVTFQGNEAAHVLFRLSSIDPESVHATFIGGTLQQAASTGTPQLSVVTLTSRNDEQSPALDALFESEKSTSDEACEITYEQLQAAGLQGEPAGHRYYTKSTYAVPLGLSDARQVVDFIARAPSELCTLDVGIWGGAVARSVPNSCFPHRDQGLMLSTSAHWLSVDDDAINIRWARSGDESMSQVSAGACYVNYATDAADATSRAYPPSVASGLAAITAIASTGRFS